MSIIYNAGKPNQTYSCLENILKAETKGQWRTRLSNGNQIPTIISSLVNPFSTLFYVIVPLPAPSVLSHVWAHISSLTPSGRKTRKSASQVQSIYHLREQTCCTDDDTGSVVMWGNHRAHKEKPLPRMAFSLSHPQSAPLVTPYKSSLTTPPDRRHWRR